MHRLRSWLVLARSFPDQNDPRASWNLLDDWRLSGILLSDPQSRVNAAPGLCSSLPWSHWRCCSECLIMKCRPTNDEFSSTYAHPDLQHCDRCAWVHLETTSAQITRLPTRSAHKGLCATYHILACRWISSQNTPWKSPPSQMCSTNRCTGPRDYIWALPLGFYRRPRDC